MAIRQLVCWRSPEGKPCTMSGQAQGFVPLDSSRSRWIGGSSSGQLGASDQGFSFTESNRLPMLTQHHDPARGLAHPVPAGLQGATHEVDT